MNKKFIMFLSLSCFLLNTFPLKALSNEEKEGLAIAGTLIGGAALLIGGILGAQWVNDKMTSDEEILQKCHNYYRSTYETHHRTIKIIKQCGYTPQMFVPAGAEHTIERLIENIDHYASLLHKTIRETQSYKDYLEKRLKKLSWDNALKGSFEKLRYKFTKLLEKFRALHVLLGRIQEAHADKNIYADIAHKIVNKQEYYRQEYEIYNQYSPYSYTNQQIIDAQLIKVAYSKGTRLDDYRYPLLSYTRHLSWDLRTLKGMMTQLDERLYAIRKRYEGLASYPLIHDYEDLINRLRNYHYILQRVYENIVNTSEYKLEKSKKQFEEECRCKEEELRRKEERLRREEKELRHRQREQQLSSIEIIIE